MISRGVKRLALLLIFLYIFLIGAGYTAADIFAERVVVHNSLVATSLDFTVLTSLNRNRITTLFRSIGIEPDGFDMGVLRVKREGVNVFKYQLKTAKTNGDDLFCGKLNLDVRSRTFGKIYSGRVMDLAVNSSLTSGSPNDWVFLVSLDDQDPSLQKKICEFNFDMKTYRDQPGERGGLFAQRLISNIVSSGIW